MDSQNPNNLPVVFKKIPNNIQANGNSPEEQEFAIIYNNGKVDYFVRCGNWGFEENDRKYLYQRITFQVDKNFYNENYKGIGEFKDKIKDNPIKQIYVEIYNPKKNSLYDNWDKKEVFKKDDIKFINNITCGNIFDAFENATYEIYTKNMCNFLASAGAHKEAFECQQSELGKNLDLIRKTGSCHVKDLTETEQKEYLGFQHKNIEIEKENNELKSLLGQLRNENIQFQNDLEQLQKENNLNPTQNILINIKNEKVQLEKGQEELKNAQNQLKNEKVLLEKGQEELQKKQVELEKGQNELKGEKVLLQNEKVLLQNEKVKFEKEKVEFQKNNPNQNILTNIQNEKVQLQNENNKLKGLLEKLQNENNQLKIDNGLLKDEKNKLKGEKDKLKGEKEENKTKVSELFQQDYVIRKEGLFGCCCGPAYRSLEAALAAAQAEKEIAIEN